MDLVVFFRVIGWWCMYGSMGLLFGMNRWGYLLLVMCWSCGICDMLELIL